MQEEFDIPVATATGFADAFVDAGVAKLDAVFGAGYAKGNPQALAAYLATCTSMLDSLLTTMASMQEDEIFEDALVAALEDLPPAPPPRSKGRRR
jgi:hypothetical protein